MGLEDHVRRSIEASDRRKNLEEEIKESSIIGEEERNRNKGLAALAEIKKIQRKIDEIISRNHEVYLGSGTSVSESVSAGDFNYGERHNVSVGGGSLGGGGGPSTYFALFRDMETLVSFESFMGLEECREGYIPEFDITLPKRLLWDIRKIKYLKLLQKDILGGNNSLWSLEHIDDYEKTRSLRWNIAKATEREIEKHPWWSKEFSYPIDDKTSKQIERAIREPELTVIQETALRYGGMGAGLGFLLSLGCGSCWYSNVGYDGPREGTIIVTLLGGLIGWGLSLSDDCYKDKFNSIF